MRPANPATRGLDATPFCGGSVWYMDSTESPMLVMVLPGSPRYIGYILGKCFWEACQ